MYRGPPPPVGLIYHPLYWRNLHLIARTRCIASPPPPAETMTKGDDDDKRRTFPPPRQAVAAVRSRVFRRPGCRRHARSTENTYIIATPEAVAGCSAPHNAPSPPGGYAVSQERHTMVRASASPSECSEFSEFSEISDCFADARPKNPQCVKIRLNRQNCRNLHAPLIAPHYLCKQNAYWPY